jgi:hypothetical protein
MWPTNASGAEPGIQDTPTTRAMPESVRSSFVARAHKLPLGMLGPVVEVDTEHAVDAASLATRVVEGARG